MLFSFKMKVFILTLATIVAVNSYGIEVKQLDNGLHFLSNSSELDWWQTAVFYQIYPRSFMDSNNDGIGDLKGIIQKLDHLKDMGITAAWLSPIFKSPQVDQGYDISDFHDIDSDYGTLNDLKELLAKAHALGIKIILDFVPNHTSDQHEWFKASVNGTKGYEDYYVWENCTKDGPPPNNWISAFKDSAWEFNAQRNQCYLHQFSIQQPDLNYRNPKVVQAMKDVLVYWLDFGIDGFRCDAVNFLFEDKALRDEPLSNIPDVPKNEYNYLVHIYTLDQTETYDMIYQWRELLDNYTKTHKTETKVMMTEAYTTIEKTIPYYGLTDGSRKGAHFTFNFNFVRNLTKGFDVNDLTVCIEKWLTNLPSIYTSNWVLGNHDNNRVATRFGSQYVDALNMIIAFLPGVMVTYNGEEIGMEDGEVKCSEGHDPLAIKNCTTFSKDSRDFERTPFQWDNSTNAGFNNGSKTWLPVSKKYTEVNLAAENVTGLNSHYNIYKELLQLRQTFNKTSRWDSVSIARLSENIVQLTRETDSDEFALLFNVGNNSESVQFLHMQGEYQVMVSSSSSYKVMDTLKNDSVTLGPFESIILNNTLVIPPSSCANKISLAFTVNIMLVCMLKYFYY